MFWGGHKDCVVWQDKDTLKWCWDIHDDFAVLREGKDLESRDEAWQAVADGYDDIRRSQHKVYAALAKERRERNEAATKTFEDARPEGFPKQKIYIAFVGEEKEEDEDATT